MLGKCCTIELYPQEPSLLLLLFFFFSLLLLVLGQVVEAGLELAGLKLGILRLQTPR